MSGDPRRQMLWDARRRAKKAGVPCTISLDDISIPERCPLLDLELHSGLDTGLDCSPTLDRLIPELGYVPGNVLVVSHRANSMKRCGSLEEIQQLAERLRRIMRPEPVDLFMSSKKSSRIAAIP